MKRPTAKEYAIAAGLARGESRTEACVKAGYSRSYAKSYKSKLTRRDGVAIALAEIGAVIPNDRFGQMGKARLQEKLVKMPKTDRDQMAVIRTALEVGGELGGPDLHLHQHNSLPPAVQAMLEAKMREILGVKDGAIIEGVPEGAASEGEGREDDEGV